MDDRIEVFWHGTTSARAQHIVAQEQFTTVGGEPLYLTAGHSGRALAEYFARRAAGRSQGSSAALVRVEIYEEDARRLRQQRLLAPKSFDEGDARELYGQTQWVLVAGAVERFNQLVEEWSTESVTG